MADRICRNCEYWDAGGERYRLTAASGDCLNRHSDRFTPEATHSCAAFHLPEELRFVSAEELSRGSA